MTSKKDRRITPYIVVGLLILVLLPSSYLIAKAVVNGEFDRRENEKIEQEKKDKEKYNQYQACINEAMAKLDKATDSWCKENVSNSEEKTFIVRGYTYCNESIRAEELGDDRQVYETEMAHCESTYR